MSHFVVVDFNFNLWLRWLYYAQILYTNITFSKRKRAKGKEAYTVHSDTSMFPSPPLQWSTPRLTGMTLSLSRPSASERVKQVWNVLCNDEPVFAWWHIKHPESSLTLSLMLSQTQLFSMINEIYFLIPPSPFTFKGYKPFCFLSTPLSSFLVVW